MEVYGEKGMSLVTIFVILLVAAFATARIFHRTF